MKNLLTQLLFLLLFLCLFWQNINGTTIDNTQSPIGAKSIHLQSEHHAQSNGQLFSHVMSEAQFVTKSSLILEEESAEERQSMIGSLLFFKGISKYKF